MPPFLFLRVALALALVLGPVLLPAPRWVSAASATPPGVHAEITIGFEEYVVPDVWIPVVVRLTSDRALAGVVEVVTTRRRPPGTERVRQAVQLAPGTPHPVTLPAVVHDLHAPLTVRLLADGETPGEWSVAVSPTRVIDGVVVAVSRRPVGLQHLLGDDSRIRVAYLAEEELPPRWELYEGVAAVVVRDLDERRLLPAQARALAGYVATGGDLFVVAPAGEIPARNILPLLLATLPPSPALPGRPGQVHPWGRGRVTVMATDPFRPDLPADAAAAWIRLLGEPRVPGLVDRSLLDLLPPAPPLSAWVQVLVVVVLGVYVVSIRWLVQAWHYGRLGTAVALVFILGITVFTAGLNTLSRRGTTGLVQVSVAQGFLHQDTALVDMVGRMALPPGGRFVLQSGSTGWVRATGAAETVLTLEGVVRLEGRSEGAVSVRGSVLLPLKVRGTYRETSDGIEVEVQNRTGRPLRDVRVVVGGRVQAVPDVGAEAHLRLGALDWREAPAVETARSPTERMMAWAIGRLRGDAILGATATLVGRLEDDRGVLRGEHEAAAPLLVVLPLRPAEAP